MKHLVLIMALSTLTFQSNAEQTDSSFYVGASLGKSDYDTSNKDFNDIKVTFDEDGNSYKLFAGYQLNDYVAFELGYVDLGELDSETTASRTDPDGYTSKAKFNNSNQLDGYTISVIGSYPITDTFNVFAKAGMYSWESEVDVMIDRSYSNPELPSGITNRTHTDDDSDSFYGLGVSYEFSILTIIAEYEVYEKENRDIDLLSVGIRYHF
ncbi:outer membrane beta-barrel protein [Colwelliaceae bacterium BS250]